MIRFSALGFSLFLLAAVSGRANAQEVFISKSWDSWFQFWGTTPSFFAKDTNANTVSVSLSPTQVCFIWTGFLESHCFKRITSQAKSQVCWTNGPGKPICASRPNDSTFIDGMDSTVFVKVASKTPFEHRNRRMVAGTYALGKLQVEFRADGTIVGWPEYSSYSLSVAATDPQMENAEISLMKGKPTKHFVLNKINGSLILRDKECLDEAIDPMCMFPLTTSIRYILQAPLQ